MCDNLNHFVIIHANEVIDAERKSHISNIVHHEGTSLKDIFYLRLGNWMVDLGFRIKSASNLSEQPSFNELSCEVS
jgi:hypothetical protein